MSAESKAWLEKWKGPSDIERVFSPQNWGYTAQDPEKAYYSNCPTIQEYDNTYGEGNAELWVYGQALALFGSSSNKEKGVVDGIKIFSQTFVSQARVYKLSELMLFFARYKAGRYDSSFSSFDARRIGNAFFKEFLPERTREIDRCVTRRTTELSISRGELPPEYIIPEGFNAFTWHIETKRLAESGDLEAIERLKPPIR